MKVIRSSWFSLDCNVYKQNGHVENIAVFIDATAAGDEQLRQNGQKRKGKHRRLKMIIDKT